MSVMVYMLLLLLFITYAVVAAGILCDVVMKLSHVIPGVTDV